MSKKFTLASAKSFLKKNAKSLYILKKSDFDGMQDCVVSTGNREFKKAEKATYSHTNNLGIQGVWFVGGGRDYFTPLYAVNSDEIVGFECYNCCGNFFVRNFA